jgi:hypothetical protein
MLGGHDTNGGWGLPLFVVSGALHGLCSGSELLIPRTHPVRRCPLWLVVTTVASVLMAGVPTVMSARRALAKRGRMSPPAEHHRSLGGFPTHAVAHLGLLVLL